MEPGEEEKEGHVQGMEETKSSEDSYRDYEIRKQSPSSVQNHSDLLLNDGHFRNPQTPVAKAQLLRRKPHRYREAAINLS